MNHPLAVYTVVYVAILFVTVSIWGGKIGDATGDFQVLLLAQALFSLKLVIDDYVHFQGATKSKLHFDLYLSLLVYLLLAISIATAATRRGSASAVAFGCVFIAGSLWIIVSGFEGEGRSRRIGWLIVNVLCAGVLSVVAFVMPPESTAYTYSSVWLLGLVALIVFDFFYFGTLRRLAALHLQAESDRSQSDGRPAPAAQAVPEIPSAMPAQPLTAEAKSSADMPAATVVQSA